MEISPVKSAYLRHRRTGVWAAGLLAAGAVLGGMAVIVRRRARKAEREHPPSGSFIEVDGVRLHYVERGQGRPVVLLHGNGSMLQDFELSGVLDGLAERYRVLAFDRPGFGHSERPRRRAWTPEAQAALMARAMRRLGIPQAVVVGHSWGTLVALAMALHRPEAVRSLVLLAGYYFPTARADVALLSPPAIPVLGDLMRYTISPLLGALLAPALVRKVFAPSPVPAHFAEFPMGLALRPSQIRASAAETAMMIVRAAVLSRRYRDLAKPVVIVAGTGDRIADVERQAIRLHRLLPQSRLMLEEGGGHMIHHVSPRQVIAAVDLAVDGPEREVDPENEVAEAFPGRALPAESPA